MDDRNGGRVSFIGFTELFIEIGRGVKVDGQLLAVIGQIDNPVKAAAMLEQIP
jgi:hypothetical protein